MTFQNRVLIAIIAVSIGAAGSVAYLGINNTELTSFNEQPEKAGLIETANGYFSVPGFLATVEASDVVDEMFLTDDPGNWFKSTSLGVPLSIVSPGEAVEFDLKGQTDAKHTVTLLVPQDRLLEIDQNRADDDKVRVKFNEPGVHLFACKVHPYMSGAVVVTDKDGNIPDVTGDDLAFVDRLDGKIGNGEPALPATTVASLVTVLAPFDEETPEAFTDLGLTLDKKSKWDIGSSSDTFVEDGTEGVGEVWINAQFEAVEGQTDKDGIPKSGTITVLDASDFSFKKEIDGIKDGEADPGIIENGDNGWNNPHNMWTDLNHNVVYNGNWFGQWLNLIDRETGEIVDTSNVGFAPTHIVTNPNSESDEFGILTLPLSAEDDILKIRDAGDELDIRDHIETGTGNNHPHGQWLTSDGSKILIPNVFQEGLAGSVTIMDAESGEIIREIQASDPDGGALLLPVAAGIKGNDKGYISNIGTGTVSVVDMNSQEIINNIKVSCFNPTDGGKCLTADDTSGIVLDTLKLPIQTPASPDGKWVATAVFSLVSQTNQDTIAIIDANADGGKGKLVAELPCPAGCHGVNWGAKNGGGYYAYVTSQHANILTVVDPDPNGDSDGSDAKIVAQIVLANGSPSGGVTDGTGGQGILPLPLVSNGWVQDSVASCNDGNCSDEVTGWINQLTSEQQNP